MKQTLYKYRFPLLLGSCFFLCLYLGHFVLASVYFLLIAGFLYLLRRDSLQTKGKNPVLIKKADPSFRGAHIGSVFQLSQDSVEGDYHLVLAMDGREAHLTTDVNGVLVLHLREQNNPDHEQVTVEGTYDDLMAAAIKWLGKFGEPRCKDCRERSTDLVDQLCKLCREYYGRRQDR